MFDPLASCQRFPARMEKLWDCSLYGVDQQRTTLLLPVDSRCGDVAGTRQGGIRMRPGFSGNGGSIIFLN